MKEGAVDLAVVTTPLTVKKTAEIRSLNGVSGDPCRKSGNGAEHEDKKDWKISGMNR